MDAFFNRLKIAAYALSKLSQHSPRSTNRLVKAQRGSPYASIPLWRQKSHVRRTSSTHCRVSSANFFRQSSHSGIFTMVAVRYARTHFTPHSAQVSLYRLSSLGYSALRISIFPIISPLSMKNAFCRDGSRTRVQRSSRCRSP